MGHFPLIRRQRNTTAPGPANSEQDGCGDSAGVLSSGGCSSGSSPPGPLRRGQLRARDCLGTELKRLQSAQSSSRRTTSRYLHQVPCPGYSPRDLEARQRSEGCLCLKNPPPPAPQPTWFTTESDCSDTTAAITAPTLFQGAELDPKKICFQLEDGSFEYREGFLANCGGPCCIFYGEAPEQ